MIEETFRDYGIDIAGGASGQKRTTCPECSSHRRKKNIRCLSVDTDKETWLCHHCGWTGGLKKQRKGFYVPPKPRKKIYTQPKYTASRELSEQVLSWFQSRGITQEVLTRNKIGYGTIFMPQVGQEVKAIQFPYFDGDKAVNIKYRDGNKNFCMTKGAERVLYGLNDIEIWDTIIVEGELDKLACEVAGYKNCVSVPDGAPTPSTKNYSSKFSFLEAVEEKLEKVLKFTIAVDNDAPGVRLREELVRRLGPEKCCLVEWPEGCKDANDVLVHQDAAKLTACIQEATPVPVKGLFSVRDIQQNVKDLYQHGFTRGESTGWKSVDNHYTIRPGEWSVVTGIPGSGKSEFLDALAVNLASINGWSIGVCSMENYPIERHFAKLAEKHANLPFQETLSCQRMSEAELQNTLSWAENSFFFLMPDEEDLTVDGVLRLAKILVYREGIKGLIIDPWNELDHTRPPGMTETEYVSQSLTKIRRFAREHEVHVWVVAHPTKLQKNKDGSYPVPTPYDISGSAHWRNKADNAISVWRDITAHNNCTVEVHVQKIRFKEIGKVGMIQLQYDYTSGRYSEV